MQRAGLYRKINPFSHAADGQGLFSVMTGQLYITLLGTHYVPLPLCDVLIRCTDMHGQCDV